MGNRTTALLIAAAVLFIAAGFVFAAWRTDGALGHDAPALAGSSEAGRRLIESYGCGACHTIPGVARAKGRVGPPLATVAERRYLGGMVPNTPQNMAAWIMNPQRYAPRTVMPNLNLSATEARDIVAYLYGLD